MWIIPMSVLWLFRRYFCRIYARNNSNISFFVSLFYTLLFHRVVFILNWLTYSVRRIFDEFFLDVDV